MQQHKTANDSYQDIFAQRADTYHEAMTRYPNARDSEFEAVVNFARLSPDSIVADIPSGGGYLENYLGDAAKTIIAVEPAEQFFLRCKETQRLRKVFSPLEELSVDEQSLDAIISLAGLHHVADRDLVFRQMYNTLVPGGTLCIADVRAGSNVDRFLNVFVHEHNSLGHEGWFVDPDFKQTLRSVGFDIEQNEVIEYNWNFESAQAMVQFCILMFGLDKATPEIVLSGIEQHLGYTTDDTGCHMNWELEFLRCNRNT